MIILLILFFAPPVLVLVINTFAFFIKEPVKKGESVPQLIEPRYTSKQACGYISGFMLPANYLISFLTVVICDHFGMDQEPAFWGPTESSVYGFLVFVALFALGTLLGIIGLVIVPREESSWRYKTISRVGFYSHIFLPVIFIAGLVTLNIFS